MKNRKLLIQNTRQRAEFHDDVDDPDDVVEEEWWTSTSITLIREYPEISTDITKHWNKYQHEQKFVIPIYINNENWNI